MTFVGKIDEIDAAGKKIKVERGIEGGVEVVEGKLPAVVSVLKGINEPRLPNLMGIRKAAKVADPCLGLAATLGLMQTKWVLISAAVRVI